MNIELVAESDLSFLKDIAKEAITFSHLEKGAECEHSVFLKCVPEKVFGFILVSRLLEFVRFFLCSRESWSRCRSFLAE
ncbi:hypothetical protein [Gynuella sunshinyii]|uniref:Uncharacterized protein n=1 Tax=Gynuella sunshinyii YC6258 TaxID=1445510 RepID=A0A0C5VYW0_9GAMM|nr:hypothetical protein [Gynuella sunshinyii]AJQ95604.1 hypothetical Protein YC6258_03568 [Gynuella sunshinyii YC6258]